MVDVVRSGIGEIDPAATQYMVRMRDGVRLATDVYLPEGDDTPGPVLLTRLPYDKNGAFVPSTLCAEYLMARGYRVVVQDVRGKFRSEGELQIFGTEAQDGYDTIEWISQQPWCDGNVAMWGTSYFGLTQLAAMTTQHPALKAISPRLTGSMGMQPETSTDGLTRHVDWTQLYMYALEHFQDKENFSWDIDWSTRPYLDSINEFLHEYGDGSNRSFDRWYPHRYPLRIYPDVANPFDARAIPTLMTIGWWDNCATWSWRDVAAMNERAAWRNAMHLLIEPIDHYSIVFGEDAGAEEPTAEPTAEQVRDLLARVMGPTVDFFDHYVRNIEPQKRIPAVRYTVANAEGVRTVEAWPPPGGRTIDLVPGADGALHIAPADRGEQTAAEWVHDPENLVPSPIENTFAFLLSTGDHEAVRAHPGVVSWASEPLTEDLEFVGAISATGRFTSTGPAMDIFVRLFDVAPDGQQMWFARGNIHVMDMSVERELTITMDYAGYRVHAGHRLIVEIASSDFPEYVPLPGNGQDPLAAAETATNTQTVLIGGATGLTLTATLSSQE